MSFRDDSKTKIHQLQEMDLRAYESKFSRTHNLEEIIDLPKGTEVKTAGRIIFYRDIGAICFFKIANVKGAIQVFLKYQDLDEITTKIVKLVNTGDIVGVEGFIDFSKTNEKSIFLTKITVLSKALEQIGDKWHGVTDPETKLRKRYIDLIANETTRKVFQIRHKLIRGLREFLYSKDFTEVETPILQNIPSGASAYPFVTHYEALDEDFYLRIAPELFLKRLVVAGYERVFEIGKCFRNEGIDRSHLQEFTMLEVYKAYESYEGLQKFAIELIQNIVEKACGTLVTDKVDFSQVEYISYDDLFIKYGGIDIRHKSYDDLKEIAEKEGLNLKLYRSFDALKDAIYKKLCLSKIVNPVLVYDYPSTPLSYPNPDKPGYNLQFQIIAGHFEIVRACIELIDSEIQNKNFEDQMKLNIDTGEKEVVRKDDDFVNALEYGMPPTAGLGLGIDRLMMLLADGDAGIRDVVLFPATRVVKK